MWSNVVSIDKEYDREINYLYERLQKMKNLSYAVEESKNRMYFYLASLCEVQDEVEESLFQIMETEFLCFIKLRYILSKLPNLDFNYANCTLISSLLHFDREYESNIVQKALSDCLDYNIDGIMNFRMNVLTENWDELCSVAAHLIENSGGEADMYDIAAFITGTENNRSRLTVSENKIFNLTNRKQVEIINLFDSAAFNIISAIIKEHPAEIVLEGTGIPEEMTDTLKRLTRVNASVRN